MPRWGGQVEVKDQLRKCWSGGLGITETQRSVRRMCNVRLDFVAVQRVFAQLARDAIGG